MSRKNQQTKKPKATHAAKNKTKDKPQSENAYSVLEPLMPELDELVKKNPNRLIGCGG